MPLRCRRANHEIRSFFSFSAGGVHYVRPCSQHFEWKGEIQANQTLEIRNVNGNIRAEPASGSEAEISVQIFGAYPTAVHIDVVPNDGGMLFCTIYEGIGSPAYCTPDQTPSVSLTNSNIRVNYTVRVPAGVNFVPRTVNGNLTVDLPRSPTTASTVNGRIVLSSSGPAGCLHRQRIDHGHARRGGLERVTEFYHCQRHGGSGNSRGLENKRPGQHAMGTNLQPVRPSGTQDDCDQLMKGDINGGGPGFILSTVNGSIHLRKGPVLQ